MSKQKNIHDNSNTGVIIATIFTILPLTGIYITPDIWWGLLLKAIFIIIILGALQNYFFQTIWVNANKHGFVAGVILNMLWFSGIYFFYPHWIIYIFILLFVLTLSTMKRILQKYYYDRKKTIR